MGFSPHSLGPGLGHRGLGAEEVVEGNQAERLAAGLIEQDGDQGGGFDQAAFEFANGLRR